MISPFGAGYATTCFILPFGNCGDGVCNGVNDDDDHDDKEIYDDGFRDWIMLLIMPTLSSKGNSENTLSSSVTWDMVD